MLIWLIDRRRAAFNGHVDIVKLLLEEGADPDCRDKVTVTTND